MRPVGAPQHPIREFLHHAAREGHDVAIGMQLAIERRRTAHRQTLGAAHLAPYVLVFTHELQDSENSGPSMGFLTSGRPMWSTTTVVGSAVKKFP